MKIFYLLLSLFISSYADENTISWSPDFYTNQKDTEISPQMFHALKEIKHLNLKGTESMLDVGCGNGEITSFIAREIVPEGKVHGIDISDAMISHAQKNTNVRNCTFSQEDLLNHSSQELYDAAVCFWVLYLIDDYSKALKKIAQNLKKGGKVLITHMIWPGTIFFDEYSKAILPSKMPFQLISLKDIATALEEVSHDFQISYLRVNYNADIYSNLDDFVNSMFNAPIFQNLPEHKKDNFLETIYQRYIPSETGEIRDTSPIVCLVLEKK